MAHSKEENKAVETLPEKTLVSDILDKEFNTSALSMLKELKENMYKYLKGIRKMKHQQNENTDRDWNCKMEPKKFWSWKHNNWIEKFTRGVLISNSNRRKNQRAWRQVIWNYWFWEAKKKKKNKEK